MKNKNVEFFFVKLLILLITETVLMLLCLAVGKVAEIVGLGRLFGERGSVLFVTGFGYAAFYVYTLVRAYRFRITENDSKRALPAFTLRESVIYAVFLLPPVILSLAAGNAGIPAWLAAFYAPQRFFSELVGSAAGYLISVLLYAAGVLAVRCAALNRAGRTAGK